MPRLRDRANANDPGSTSEEAVSGEANQPPRHTAAVGGPPAAAMQTNGHVDPATSSTSASTIVGEAHTAVTGRPPVPATPTTLGHADPVGPSSPLASASTGEANRLRREFDDVFRPFDFDDSDNATSRFNAEFRDRTPRRRPSTVWAGYHQVLNASDEFQREAISNGIRELVKDRFINKRVALMQLRSYGIVSRPAPPKNTSPDQKPSANLSPSAADAAASATTPVVVDTGVLDSTSEPCSRTTGGTTTPPAMDASEDQVQAVQPPPRRRTISTPESTRDFSLIWFYGRDPEDDETTTNLCGILKRIPRRHHSKEVQKEVPEEPKPLVQASPVPSRRTRNQRQVSIPQLPKSKAATNTQNQRTEASEANDTDSLVEADPAPRRRSRSSPETTRDFSLIWNYGHEVDEDEDTANYCRIMKTIARRHRSKESQGEATKAPEASIEDMLEDTVERLGNTSISEKKPASPVHVDTPPPPTEAPAPPADSSAHDDSTTQNGVSQEAKGTEESSAIIEPVAKVVQGDANEVEYSIDDTIESLAQISLSASGVNSAIIEEQHSANNEDPLESTQSSNETVDVEMPSVVDESGSQEVVPLSRDTRSMPHAVTKEVKGDENEVEADTMDATVATLSQINISENGVNPAVNEEQPSARSEPCLDSTQSSDDVEMSATSDEREAQQVIPSSLETSSTPQIQPDPPVSIDERVSGRDEANVEMEVAETPQVDHPVSSTLEQPNRVADPLYQRRHQPLIARRQSRVELLSRLSQTQHQRQSRISTVQQPQSSDAESAKNVESKEKREVVAASSASSPQKRKNELQGQSKPAVTQKGPHHRPSQKQQAKARKSTTRQSPEVESSTKAPASQPPATSDLQQLNEQATPATVPQRTDEALKPIQKKDDTMKQTQQSRMLMISQLPRAKPSRRGSGGDGKLRLALISTEQRRRKCVNTKRQMKSPIRAEQPASVQNIAPASEDIDRVDEPEGSIEAAPPKNITDRVEPETRQLETPPSQSLERDTSLPMPSKGPRSSKKPKKSAKEPIKGRTVRRSREKNETSSQKSLHRAEARKSTIRKLRKNAKEAEKAAETPQKRPKQAIPQEVPAGNGDSLKPNHKSDDPTSTQRRLFMVSRLPRFVPSPRNGSQGKLRFSLISKEQRRRMSMNTRRSTKSPNQSSIPVPQAPVPAMNASAFLEAQPVPSKPAKSPLPQPKESKKKASTKTITPETVLLPRLRTEVWRDLLRSGALRFPEQQESANVSRPISANELSNALRKQEAEECEAKSPPSAASPDSSRAKPADAEDSVDKDNESTVKSPQKSPVKSPERSVTSPQKPPTPTVPLPSEVTDDRKEAAPGDAAQDKPSKPKRKRSSDSDSDKAPVRRPRLDVPIPAIDDESKDASPNGNDPKKPIESVEGTAQPPPAVAQSDEDAQEEPAEAMEPVNAPPEDVAMDGFFDVPPPDDLDPNSEPENDAGSEAHEVESTIDLESSEVESVNGSAASEVGSFIISEASESGNAESGSERSASPGPSTRPSRKRKAVTNPNEGPSSRRRPPQTDSESDEAPQPRSSNRRARQPRNPPTFGHLEHIDDIEGVDLPNAPPVVVRQREVVDNVRLTADQQVEVLRGNDVTIARYESGAVVMQGRFNGGSTASQLMRDALRQPQVLFNDPEDRIVQMALGNEHLIMRSISGDIYTVGRATEGQLGVARHRFYRQSSVTPQTMRRIVVDDEGHDVFFTDIRAEGNITVAIAHDGSEYRCGGRHGPLLAKLRRD